MQDQNNGRSEPSEAGIFTLPPQQRDAPDLATVAVESLLDVHGAARMLNVTVSWMYEHIRADANDRVPHVKLGKYVRFHPDDLRAYVNAKRQRTSPRKR
jgi:hypothetical protein